MINYRNLLSLKDKKIVVSGGAGLIGREVVAALGQGGARVIIADVNEALANQLAEQLNKENCKVEYYAFDITDLPNLEKNINKLVSYLGGIDVWINSAFPRTADWGVKIEQISLDSWRKNIDMHLNAYALSAKFIAEHIKKGDSIILFGSTYGVCGPSFSIYHKTEMTSSMIYAVIKGGIVNLGRYLASYFGEYNIGVNVVCPGGVFDNQDPIFVNNYSKRVPLVRMAKPEEIAPICYLLSSDASSYITGAIIMVDGGWSAI